MKNIIKISFLFVALLSMTATLQAQKFGYINSVVILNEMPEFRQANSNLETLQKQLMKKGQGMVELFEKDLAAIQQKVANGQLSPVEQEEEGKKLEERKNKIGKFEQEMQTQLKEKSDELLSPLVDEVNQAIKDVAKEGGYQMIFDQSTGIILFADESTDLSDQVKVKLGM